MFKQAILVVLLITLALVSSTLAEIPASFNVLGNVFNRSIKRTIASDYLCCFPPVFSMASSNVYASFSNNTLQTSTTTFALYADFKVGKLRQETNYMKGTNTVSMTSWSFKVSETLTVHYSAQGGECTCSKSNYQQQWDPICVPTGKIITIATIGAYTAKKVEISSPNGATGYNWIFKEPQMANDKCWILNSYIAMSSSTSEQNFYNMVEMVDSNVFKVPSQCPSMESCLAK